MELEAVRDGDTFIGATLTTAGLFVAGLMLLVAPLVGYLLYQGSASAASLVFVALCGFVGLAVGVAGMQEFIHRREPFTFTTTSVSFGFKQEGHVERHLRVV